MSRTSRARDHLRLFHLGLPLKQAVTAVLRTSRLRPVSSQLPSSSRMLIPTLLSTKCQLTLPSHTFVSHCRAPLQHLCQLPWRSTWDSHLSIRMANMTWLPCSYLISQIMAHMTSMAAPRGTQQMGTHTWLHNLIRFLAGVLKRLLPTACSLSCLSGCGRRRI